MFSSLVPQNVRLLPVASMPSLCCASALAPLCVCTCERFSVSPYAIPPFPSLCPCPPPCCSVLLLPGCRCSRLVPLHFWSQPKPSWPWRDGNAPQKVGILLGSVVERRAQEPGGLGDCSRHQGAFMAASSLPLSLFPIHMCVCPYLCLRGDLRKLESAPEHLSHLAPTDTRGGFAHGVEETCT